MRPERGTKAPQLGLCSGRGAAARPGEWAWVRACVDVFVHTAGSVCMDVSTGRAGMLRRQRRPPPLPRSGIWEEQRERGREGAGGHGAAVPHLRSTCRVSSRASRTRRGGRRGAASCAGCGRRHAGGRPARSAASSGAPWTDGSGTRPAAGPASVSKGNVGTRDTPSPCLARSGWRKGWKSCTHLVQKPTWVFPCFNDNPPLLLLVTPKHVWGYTHPPPDNQAASPCAHPQPICVYKGEGSQKIREGEFSSMGRKEKGGKAGRKRQGGTLDGGRKQAAGR